MLEYAFLNYVLTYDTLTSCTTVLSLWCWKCKQIELCFASVKKHTLLVI